MKENFISNDMVIFARTLKSDIFRVAIRKTKYLKASILNDQLVEVLHENTSIISNYYATASIKK